MLKATLSLGACSYTQLDAFLSHSSSDFHKLGCRRLCQGPGLGVNGRKEIGSVKMGNYEQSIETI